ncbi:hypothetical protein SCACP_14570 [Sporomusa carbonis]|uniref:type 4a pilus biogenesis protein PilO n=1 Tax=Sporomusa carbonis TaxID=3076075 RepID=UPI003A63AAC5
MTALLAKLETKHKLYILGLGVVLLTTLFYILVLSPQRDRIAELKSEYQAESQRVKTIEAFAMNHPDLDQYLNELDNKLAQSDNKLPGQPEVGEFLKDVEQAAKGSGIQLSEIKPSPAANKESYREIPVEINVKGTYLQTLDFIKKLEDSRRFNAVTNVNIQAKQGSLESKLNLIIYSYGVAPGAVSNKQQSQPPVKK